MTMRAALGELSLEYNGSKCIPIARVRLRLPFTRPANTNPPAF